MALTKPKFAPGIIKDDSPLAAEGGWTDGDKIRFHPDKPETIGGWVEIALSQDTARLHVFDDEVFDPVVFADTFVSTSELFPGRVSGAHAWNDNDSKAYLAWGTSSGLFVMYDSIVHDITPTEFTPEPTVTGSSIYGDGDYNEDVYGSKRPVLWSVDNWGQNLLACARGGTLYEWTPGDTRALAVAGAPDLIDYFFVSPERIVVLLGTEEFGASFNPMLVRWCDQGDNTQWTPATSNLAGEVPVSGGAQLLSGVVTRAQNVLWSDNSCFTMQATGDVNSVFIIKVVGRGCGLIGPFARTVSDSAVYWASRDNFYAFTGQVPVVLPSAVRREVFDNIFAGQEEKIHAGWNTGFQEPWFFYPDARDMTGDCSRYAMMNSAGAWAIGTFDRTAWIKAGVFPYPVAFSSNHKLYYHEVPNAGDAGGPLEAFVESGFVDVGDGDTLYVIKRAVPDFASQAANVDITFKTRFWPNEASTARGPYTATPTKNKLDMRLKAREIAVRLESAGADGASFWQLGALSFDAQPSGEKR